MNKIDELKLNVESFLHAVKEDREFFAPIYTFIEELHNLLTVGIHDAKKEKIKFFSDKIESFFKKYSYSGKYDMQILSPSGILQNDETVKEISRISEELTELSDDDFEKIKPSPNVFTKTNDNTDYQKIFIGHGRSKLWARLQIFIKDELGIETISYESESRVSEPIVPVLQKMLDQSTFAILVLTAEDQVEQETRRARQNVVHEAGLFQGRLGFDKVILLVQRGLESFTNVDGLQYIPFSDEHIEETFYELRRTIEQKGIINT